MDERLARRRPAVALREHDPGDGADGSNERDDQGGTDATEATYSPRKAASPPAVTSVMPTPKPAFDAMLTSRSTRCPGLPWSLNDGDAYEPLPATR